MLGFAIGLVIAFRIFLLWWNSPKQKGKCGEKLVAVTGASAFFTHRGEKLRGLAKGFTNVTPGAPHDSAASKWRICSLAASAMPRMWYNVRHDFGRQSKSVYHPALCGEAAATNITLQKESGSVARSTGEAVAEPL